MWCPRRRSACTRLAPLHYIIAVTQTTAAMLRDAVVHTERRLGRKWIPGRRAYNIALSGGGKSDTNALIAAADAAVLAAQRDVRNLRNRVRSGTPSPKVQRLLDRGQDALQESRRERRALNAVLQRSDIGKTCVVKGADGKPVRYYHCNVGGIWRMGKQPCDMRGARTKTKRTKTKRTKTK